jgi:transporter family protein
MHEPYQTQHGVRKGVLWANSTAVATIGRGMASILSHFVVAMLSILLGCVVDGVRDANPALSHPPNSPNAISVGFPSRAATKCCLRLKDYTSGMFAQKWFLYAVLAAASAALVSIFGKVGMNEVNPVLATALRSVVMMVFTLAVCTLKNRWVHLSQLHPTALVMITLAGIAGATSWLFGFEALSIAKVSQVAPIDKLSVPLAAVLAVIFLGERPTGINWIGIALIAAGAYLTALPAHPR